MVESQSQLCFRELWKCEVPIQLSLSSQEIATNTVPTPLYILVPRMSYLHIVAVDIVKKHFSSFILPTEDEIWFEFNGIPLKWFLSIGVLYDIFHSKLDNNLNVSPWNIVVHFSNFPTSLPRCYSLLDKVRQVYFHVLKQALYMKYGSISSILEVNKSQQNILWNSIINRSFQFFNLLSPILNPHALPSDVIVSDSNLNHDESVLVYSNYKTVKQIPIRVFLNSNTGFYSQRPFPFSNISIDEYMKTVYGVTSTSVIIHGIKIDTDLLITTAYEWFVNIDGWLYIFV